MSSFPSLENIPKDVLNLIFTFFKPEEAVPSYFIKLFHHLPSLKNLQKNQQISSYLLFFKTRKYFSC